LSSLHLIIFTGVSGGGKTTALKAVEDLGFYCVDNLPLPLLDSFIETMEQETNIDHIALVVDSRVVTHFEGFDQALRRLKSSGNVLEVVYLDANDEVLTRRFSQTRRPHPLSLREDLATALAEERDLLAPMRTQAGTCIDTSEMTVHQLKRVIQDRYEMEGSKLLVSFISFGFRYGLPSHADMAFDVRFLPNPFFVEDLKPLSGLEEQVSDYVLEAANSRNFLDQTEMLLAFLLPLFEQEGKVYLTVAVGCTGGRHRSVAIVEELAWRMGEQRSVKVRHRDLDRGDSS